jgi:hypothetical protein
MEGKKTRRKKQKCASQFSVHNARHKFILKNQPLLYLPEKFEMNLEELTLLLQSLALLIPYLHHNTHNV